MAKASAQVRNVLSIQSGVVYGHVGQGAACFALQRLGHEVWAVPTVQLSSHAGRPVVAGETVSPDLIGRLIGGLLANGWLAKCDAILSGYLGDPAQAEIVADTVRQVKRANPAALYCLDPVFGDHGRVYAKRGVAEAMAKSLLPLADIVAPNVFELTTLSGVAVRDADEALAAARRLGRPCVLVTSVPDGADRLGTLAVAGEEAWFASTPRLKDIPQGAGDLLAALYLGHRLRNLSVAEALRRAVAAVFHQLRRSVDAGADEMPLVQEQDALAKPPNLARELRLRALP